MRTHFEKNYPHFFVKKPKNSSFEFFQTFQGRCYKENVLLNISATFCPILALIPYFFQEILKVFEKMKFEIVFGLNKPENAYFVILTKFKSRNTLKRDFWRVLSPTEANSPYTDESHFSFLFF